MGDEGVILEYAELKTDLWQFANDMRELEDFRKLPPSVRLERYKDLRAELERKLAETEDRELPDEHRTKDQ